jgi:TM2 domain-containing membrane protein YozV
MTQIPVSIKSQLPAAVQRKVEAMDDINQEAFVAEFKKKQKSPFWAFMLLMSVPSFHYFYLGKIWLNIFFWATIGGGGIWWFIDLFRTVGMVRDYNKTVAISVLKDIQILN